MLCCINNPRCLDRKYGKLLAAGHIAVILSIYS